jgi:hypothetical protein
MRKITFLFILMFAFIWQSNAQCINPTLYPTGDITANNNGVSQTIATCSYSGEYSSLIGLAIGDEYQFSVNLNSTSAPGYVTVVDAADGTTVLANGVSPLNWVSTVSAIQLHWTNDGACAADAACHTTTYLDVTNIPPPISNDECSGAISIACDETVIGTTAVATDSGGNSNLAKDVWFSYTGSGSAEDVTLTLCNSAYDTFVRVYNDCSVTLPAQVAANDDACGTRSTVTFASNGTSTYYIMIEGYGSANGDFEMTATCAANVPAPANDLCLNAIELALNNVTSGTTAGATDNSTGNIDDTTCESFTFKSDVWYYFTAADTDVSIVTTITGTSDQANVAVYDSTDCTQLDNNSIACESGNGGESFNLTGLTQDNVYYIRVWSDGVAPRTSQARTEGTFDILVNDATLSTNEFENVNSFTYFPNPVRNELTLKAQSNIQNVSILNMLGQEVLRAAPNTLESEVNMNQLQSGAYFVKVTINDSTETIRVIKQ